MPSTLNPPSAADAFAERLRHAMRRHGSGEADISSTAEAPDADPIEPAATATADADRCADEHPACVSVGEGEYVVGEHDCLSSIAKQTGRLWETIWNDPANTVLREARKDPNVLLTGDRVTIPPLRQRSEPGQTELRHRFVRVGQPTVFQLRLAHNGEPLAQRSYIIKYDDGEEFAGATNSEGFLRCPMPSDALHGRLSVSAGPEDDDETQYEYKLQFGKLQPIDSLVGVQQRLRNLGFYDGANTAELDDRTRGAIEVYQSSRNGLEVTGTPDAATRKRLRDEHGS